MTAYPKIPELRTGDVLTRDEFERRYTAMPNLKRAELIEGVVYMPSPVRHTFHGRPHAQLAGWLGAYEVAAAEVESAIASTFRIDLENEVQPDLMMRRTGPDARSRIDADGYIEGAPELLIEIAASSVSYDLHQKKRIYRRAGVREYLVLRSEDAAVDWFVLERGEYVPLVPDAAGVLRSSAFRGLWLGVAQLLAGDDAGLRSVLQAGLADLS